MKRFIPGLGVIGVILGIGGLIAYSLDPGKMWLVTVLESLALVSLVVFFVTHYETVKTFSTRRSTRLGMNSIVMVVMGFCLRPGSVGSAGRRSGEWRRRVDRRHCAEGVQPDNR